VSRSTQRSFAVAAGLLAAGLAITPAVAAGPKAKPTSLTMKATKVSVLPSQKDTLTAVLKNGTHVVAGQTVVLEKRAAGAKKWLVAATRKTNAKGAVALVVIPGIKKGQKEQYELIFPGNKTYARSHSAIITVTVA
jgi:hypothetical protein